MSGTEQVRYLCFSHAMRINTETREVAYRLYGGAGTYVTPTYEQYGSATLATREMQCAMSGDTKPNGDVYSCDDVYRWTVADHYASDIRPSHVRETTA